MFKFKKIVLVIILLFISNFISAQCAMCKAVIETGNESMAEGVNSGITYLMVFPYVLIGLLFFFIYRHRKNQAKN